MQYAVIRLDKLTKKSQEKLLQKNAVIDGRELIQMNAAAKIELANGRVHLNGSLIRATDHLVREEVNASINAHEARHALAQGSK